MRGSITPNAPRKRNSPPGGNALHYWAVVALQDELEALDLAPRWVLTDGKAPIHAGWTGRRPDLRAVLDHLRDGGGLGIEPASIGAAVLDVDRAPSEALHTIRAVGIEPWASVPSRRRGGVHHYARIEHGFTGGPWAYGDIRGRSQVAVLHHPKVLAEQVHRFTSAPAAPEHAFRQLRMWGPDIIEGGRRLLPRRGEPIPEGVRNEWLFRSLIPAARKTDILRLALDLNRNRCVPPLSLVEVRKVAASAIRTRERNRARGVQNSRRVLGGRRSGAVRWEAAEVRYEAIRVAAATDPGLSVAALARRFGVSRPTVDRAFAGGAHELVHPPGSRRPNLAGEGSVRSDGANDGGAANR